MSRTLAFRSSPSSLSAPFSLLKRSEFASPESGKLADTYTYDWALILDPDEHVILGADPNSTRTLCAALLDHSPRRMVSVPVIKHIDNGCWKTDAHTGNTPKLDDWKLAMAEAWNHSGWRKVGKVNRKAVIMASNSERMTARDSHGYLWGTADTEDVEPREHLADPHIAYIRHVRGVCRST